MFLTAETQRTQSLSILIHEALQTILENGDVEVDEESHTLSGHPEIGQELGLVDGKQPLNGFDLDDDSLLHKEIEPIAAVQENPLVLEGQIDLTLECQASEAQLMAETLLVG
jgi:hypothetical protein